MRLRNKKDVGFLPRTPGPPYRLGQAMHSISGGASSSRGLARAS